MLPSGHNGERRHSELSSDSIGKESKTADENKSKNKKGINIRCQAKSRERKGKRKTQIKKKETFLFVIVKHCLSSSSVLTFSSSEYKMETSEEVRKRFHVILEKE